MSDKLTISSYEHKQKGQIVRNPYFMGFFTY